MQKKVNILFLIDGLGGGGKERQLVEILKCIDRTKFKLGVVTFNDNQFYTKQVVLLVHFYKFLKKRPFRIEPFFSIWKCYYEFEPEIVHTWDSLSSLYSYMPSKFFRTKIIDGSIRDAGIEKGWQKAIKKFFLTHANLVVANSITGLKVYKVNGEVVYNAINVERYIKNDNESEVNIIMVANFTNYKDHQSFIRAAVQLINERVINNAFLLGDGPNRARYISMIEKEYPNIKEKIVFTGSVTNVQDYLAKCKIGVLCSTTEYSEGLSNSILEYMAAGLIAIATKIGGSSEIIEHEKNGFLIAPGNYDMIVEIIKKVLADKDMAFILRGNAYETLNQKFNYKRNIKLYETIYLKLIEN